jgi:hypothetical protein
MWVSDNIGRRMLTSPPRGIYDYTFRIPRTQPAMRDPRSPGFRGQGEIRPGNATAARAVTSGEAHDCPPKLALSCSDLGLGSATFCSGVN